MRWNRLLALLSIIALAAAAKTSENLDTYKGCGPTGTAHSACGKALDKLKNRWRDPGPSNPSITVDAILAPGDDTDRFKSDDAATITGYVSEVDPGGKQESCNCKDPNLQDVHIYVVRDPADAPDQTKRMVVEITPREQHLHPQWTLKWAQKNLNHKWVRFTGYMLFDAMHSQESQNTKDKPQQCPGVTPKEIWRATAWEVHPVTDLKVLPGKP